MELDKFNELRNSIIKNTIKKITSLYTITNYNEIVTVEQLEKDLLTKNKCIGVIVTGSNAHQCSKKSLPNENYCNLHYTKYIKNENYKEIEEITEFEERTEIEESTEFEEIDIRDCTRQLIGNTFYYIDVNYIYTSNGSKVGIVKNQKYILTDDPFILGS